MAANFSCQDRLPIGTYKGYRAGVRAKVLLLRAMHTKDATIHKESVRFARNTSSYWPPI